MQVVYERCAGLDVHKKTVSACISVCEGRHEKQQETRAFGTFTQDLLKLADWLKEHGVTHVAMEATGVYWRPVWAAALSDQPHFARMRHDHFMSQLAQQPADPRVCVPVSSAMRLRAIPPNTSHNAFAVVRTRCSS